MSSKVFLPPLARLLMSSLFVWDGIVQLRNPGGTAQYFANVHVPAPDVTVWISILVHLLGGLALSAGFYSRWAAALLVLVCLGTAFDVHLPAEDPNNMTNFYKNLVMTGGFLYVIAFGPGAISLDRSRIRACRIAPGGVCCTLPAGSKLMSALLLASWADRVARTWIMDLRRQSLTRVN